MVPLAKLRDFSQAIFDSASEVVPVGLGGAQFILVSLSDLGGPLRQFRLEARPRALVVMIVFALEQAERFFGGKLRDTCEVLRLQGDPESQCASASPRPSTDGHSMVVIVSPHLPSYFTVYGALGKIVWFWAEIFGNTHSAFLDDFSNRSVYSSRGRGLTIRELIEEQRRRLGSANPAETIRSRSADPRAS